VIVAEKALEIKNRLGLNLLAASTLARTAGKFAARTMIGCGKNQVSAKSVMELIMLEAGQGSKLKLRAEGDDAIDAVAAIQALFEKRFGQE
jgi:phosphocarrier protein HPr